MNNYQLPEGIKLKNRYEIVKVLGQGAFGITYSAFDHLINARVVVKEFYPQDAVSRNCAVSRELIYSEDVHLQERINRSRSNFIREAQIHKRLKDTPYIARYRDYFEENNTFYLVMNQINGTAVTRFHGSRKKFFEACSSVLDALESIHAMGIIHRDISPGNLILAEDGNIYLIDFGAAAVLDSSDELYSREVADHKGFNAPEYNDISKQGTWTDIYMLCSVIVYVLSGEAVQLPADRMQHDTVPQLLVGHGISGDVQNALMQGLQLDIESRIQTAGRLRERLYKNAAKDIFTPQKVEYAYFTSTNKRAINQDSFVVDLECAYQGEDCSGEGVIKCEKDHTYLIAVADGVGGSCHGELASRAVCQALTHFLENYAGSTSLIERLVERLLDQVNEKIVHLGTKIGKTATTVSILMWRNDRYYAINIGDSPIYHYSRAQLERLSVPHTKAHMNMLSDRGVKLSDTHTLVNYLGKDGIAGSDMISYREGKIRKGDIFMVCSDGVSDEVSDGHQKMLWGLWKLKAVNRIKKIIKKAKGDNATAIVIRVE